MFNLSRLTLTPVPKLVLLKRPERPESLNLNESTGGSFFSSASMQRIPKNSIPIFAQQSSTKIEKFPDSASGSPPLYSLSTSPVSAQFLNKSEHGRRHNNPNHEEKYCNFLFGVGKRISKKIHEQLKYNFSAWYYRLYSHSYNETAFHILDFIEVFKFPNIYRNPELYDREMETFTDKGNTLRSLLTIYFMGMMFSALRTGNIESITSDVTRNEFEFDDSSLLLQSKSSFKEFIADCDKQNNLACIKTIRFALCTKMEFFPKKQNQRSRQGTFRSVFSVCLLDTNLLIQPVTHFVITSRKKKQDIEMRANALPKCPVTWQKSAEVIFSKLLIDYNLTKAVRDCTYLDDSQKAVLIEQLEDLWKSLFKGRNPFDKNDLSIILNNL